MKNFFILLFLIFCCGQANANKREFATGLFWEVTTDNVLIISGKGKIPDYGKGTGKQPWNTTKYRKSIRKIVIEEGITRVGNYAFFFSDLIGGKKEPDINRLNIANYNEVILPSTLESIGYRSFGASSITSIIIPDNCNSFGKSPFWGSKLNKFEIPNSWCRITDSFFSGCSNLKKIDIPENIKEIGEYAFSYCSLESVTLPVGLEKIGTSAFKSNDFREIVFPSTLKSIGYGAFEWCDGLEKVDLSKTTRVEIAKYAFDLCPIKQLWLNENAKIGKDAFRPHLNALFNGDLRGFNLNEIDNSEFYGISRDAVRRYQKVYEANNIHLTSKRMRFGFHNKKDIDWIEPATITSDFLIDINLLNNYVSIVEDGEFIIFFTLETENKNLSNKDILAFNAFDMELCVNCVVVLNMKDRDLHKLKYPIFVFYAGTVKAFD